MGGYGLFVWGSYGAAVLCIAIELLALKQRARRLASAESAIDAGERRTA